MYEATRHTQVTASGWNLNVAKEAIEEIIQDAEQRFNPERFWPAHSQDEGIGDGDTSLYMGASGVIWALQYLRRMNAGRGTLDLHSVLPELKRRNLAEYSSRPYAAHGSLLFGDLGTNLVAMTLAPEQDTANAIYLRAEANTSLPIGELMWGLPGSMLACLHMAKMIDEDRWKELFQAQAALLLAALIDTDKGPLWNQDLYGTIEPWLGPVHGYAGNMIPLMQGWQWLGPQQRARVTAAVPQTLDRNAWSSGSGVNWLGRTHSKGPPKLCQHCHGSPGMVTAFADAPFTSPELEDLLLRAGELTWTAGPLSKGSNLCHGTGGNGYAFLKLYRRTGDTIWLERARAFAMMGIAQCRDARTHFGRGRYSLWTGDVGLAIYLWDCMRAEPAFPSIDVF